jgi:hypothetical protein
MRKPKRERSGLDKFAVRLNGKTIDVLYLSANGEWSAEELRKSLVNHDGYDSRITVKCTQRAR